MRGIEEYWSDSFKDSKGNVAYNVSTYAGISDNGIKAKIIDKNGQSIHSRPWFGGWSYNNPGSITMYTGFKNENGPCAAEDFMNSSAHEFGHVLGLKDNYNSGVRTIMESFQFGRSVTYRDIYNVLEAKRTGKWGK